MNMIRTARVTYDTQVVERGPRRNYGSPWRNAHFLKSIQVDDDDLQDLL